MKHLSNEDSDLKYTTLLLTLGLAGFVSAADNWFISPSLPAIAAAFNVSIPRAGIILTAYMIPYGLMQPVYGFFSDRSSKVRVLRWIVLGLALGTFGCAISSSLFILCLWRVITGFFAAGIIAVSLALIGDTVPTVKRQTYVGKFMGIVFLGQGISSGLGGALAKYFTWRVAFTFFAGISILAVLLLYRISDESKAPLCRSFFKETKSVVTSQKGKLIFPLALLTGFLLLGLYSYLGAFLHESAGLDYLQGGTIIMFYGFACLFAGSQVGKLGQKFGQKITIIIGGSLALVTSLILAIFPYWQAALIAIISLGFGYIFIQSTLATMAFEVATEAKGLPSGIIGVCLFCGGGLGSAFSGWILSEADYKILWLVLALGIVIFIFVANLLFNHQRN